MAHKEATLETTKTKAPVFNVRVDGNYGEFVLEPLERGFGVTLGNPLRRILLSSIPGTAVTSAYIEDVLHEFSTIKGVKEDAIQLILNLKELVVKFHAPGSKTLTLRAQGPKQVFARDLEVPSDAEIINPDLYLATLDKGGKLVMEVRVDEGVGYMPAEKHGLKDRISSIPVDALFPPVRRVAFQIEPTRVEQSTEYDRLVLDIETDGSISPREALASAGDTLRSRVGLVAEMRAEPQGLELGEVATTTAGSPDLDLPIEDLDLSERPRNCLKRAQVNSIGELLLKTEDDLLAITNFGQKSLDEVIEKLNERGLALRTKD